MLGSALESHKSFLSIQPAFMATHIQLSTSNTARSILYVAAVINVLLLVYHILDTRPHIVETSIGQGMKYNGDEFPLCAPENATGPYIPLALPDVAYTVEDSDRFMVDEASASAWWSTLPTGWGYLRLGEQRRAFALSMSHQRHCLTFLSRSISLRIPPDAHLQHCFNYLRQLILCAADGTLEDPHWEETRRGWESVRTVGRERVCRDWRVVETLVDQNFDDWMQYKKEHVDWF